MKKCYSLKVLLFLLVILFLSTNSCSAATNFRSGWVTLKNGRLSIRGKLNSSISSGGTQGVFKNTSDTAQINSDVDTKNLFPYDEVCFNNPWSNGCVNSTTYTVNNKLSDNITFNLATGDTVPGGVLAGNMIIASQSGQVILSFVPNNIVPIGGRVRILMPYASTGGITSGTASDGIPDPDGFDSSKLTTANLNTYSSFSSSTTAAPSITSANLDVGGTNTNKFTLDYVVGTVALAVGQSYSLSIGSTGTTVYQFINPAPANLAVGGTGLHTRGVADSYSIAVETYDGSAVLLDSSSLKVVANDGVQVSVTVPLFLNYTIAGITTGTAPCYSGDTGTTMLNTTTATDASYGTGANTSNTFYIIGQTHTVSTNASGGYTINVYASGDTTNGVLYDGAGSASTDYIPHTSCDASGCATPGTFAAWATATNNGFGISTQERANIWTRFGVGQSASFAIKTNAAAASNESTNTCYKLSFAGTQGAGYYSGTLTYIATPRF